jgi:NADPH-dependent curcumin reductase CurA
MNTKILLKSRPISTPSKDNFEIVSEPIPKPTKPKEVLVHNIYISLDPG